MFDGKLEQLVDCKYRVPQALEQLIEYLEQNGVEEANLFQASDYHYFIEKNAALKKDMLKDNTIKTRVEDIKQLRKRLLKHNEITHELQVVADIHVVTGLLKLFFHTLEDPLLTFRLYDKFAELCHHTDPVTKNIGFRSLIYSMSDTRQAVLNRLCHFFCYILQAPFQAKHGLTPAKLAMIFGPLLLRSNTTQDSTAQSANAVTVIQYFIENYDDIFKTTNANTMLQLIQHNQQLTHQLQSLQCQHQQLELKYQKASRGKCRAILMKIYESKANKCFQAWRWYVYSKRTEHRVHESLHQTIKTLGLPSSEHNTADYPTISSPTRPPTNYQIRYTYT